LAEVSDNFSNTRVESKLLSTTGCTLAVKCLYRFREDSDIEKDVSKVITGMAIEITFIIATTLSFT
jgi:hypothetical protein